MQLIVNTSAQYFLFVFNDFWCNENKKGLFIFTTYKK